MTTSVRARRAGLTRVLAAVFFAVPFLAGVAASVLAAPPAAAQNETEDPTHIDDLRFDPDAGHVDILQLTGLLDPLVADFVADKIDNADPGRVRTIVLAVNSNGSVASPEQVNRVGRSIAESRIPVVLWVGPPNARALGPWAELAGLADAVALAGGARIGDIGPDPVLDPALSADMGPAGAALINGTVNDVEALESGVATIEAGTLGDLFISLGEFGVETVVVETDDGLRTVAMTTPRFQRLSMLARQLHTVASPPVAYMLFTIGLALLVFEFYTAGVGVAGLVGAAMFALGAFGLWILPANWWGIALIVFSMFAFSIDVQTGVPRFWTVVGVIALIAGTVTLYASGASMSWIPMVVVVVGVSFTMVTGMPTMVRTRFSTPTIGREWMIGSLGQAVDEVAPDGVVEIDGAHWRARTNRATPIQAGETARVVAVEGLVLEIEPQSGGAQDYRERRTAHSES